MKKPWSDDDSNLRLFIDSVADYSILSLDTDGDVASWNTGAQRLKGYAAEEIVGRHFSAFYPEEDRVAGLPEQLLQIARDNGHVENSGWRIRKDGTKFWGNVMISAIRDEDGELIGFSKITRDLTERKEAEEREQQLSIDLERANRLKSEFLAHMSHEIRTPLNGIIGMLTLLSGTPLNEEQQRFAKTAISSSESLIRIVNDILDVSKVEAGSLELEMIPFVLGEITTGVIDLFRPLAQFKGIELVSDICPDVPPFVIGDPTRLRQVLSNLVSNAIKFTETGFVKLHTFQPAPGVATQITFEIQDTGIGMAEEDRARLFDPFAQADASTTRRFGGTGLGLTISQHMVDLMGGRLEVVSKQGEGSRFFFTVDLGIADESVVDLGDKAKAIDLSETGGDVLVAEDNEINQQVMSLFLTRLGYTPTVVANGLGALEALEHNDYLGVLMDCHMPVMDGFEATRRIRALDSEKANVQIVAVTASALPKEIQQCMEAGMNDVIAKPVQIKQLESLLREWSLKPATNGKNSANRQ